MHRTLLNAYTTFSWVLLLGCVVGWPLSQLSFAKHEPATILALSWGAMVVAALGNLATVYVFREVKGGE